MIVIFYQVVGSSIGIDEPNWGELFIDGIRRDVISDWSIEVVIESGSGMELR